MTTVAPVNPRATVPAVFCEDWPDEGTPAGHWHFYVSRDVADGQEPAGILFGCPCGCGQMNSVAFRASREGRPSWEWDGNREKPTLSPSINILQLDEAGKRTGEHWHGWLRDGVFQSC